MYFQEMAKTGYLVPGVGSGQGLGEEGEGLGRDEEGCRLMAQRPRGTARESEVF